MKSNLFLICNKTNLHAGDGDASDGLIDKTVQRDPTTKLPVIHASGLKGSLRERFKNLPDALKVFGKDPKGEPSESGNKGSHIFWDARLLALPIQDDEKGYILASTEEIINDFKDIVGLCQCTPAKGIDDFVTSKGISLIDSEEFKGYCNRLHVIARNNLENGKSVNLWYEEVVPRQALFYIVIQHPEAQSALIKAIKESSLIQIGANATIGYGQCQFTLLT